MADSPFQEHCLEIEGGHETDGGMDAVAVVEALDEVENFDGRRVEINERFKVNKLFFDDGVERLHGRVVDRSTFRAVRQTHTQAKHRGNEQFRGVLRALVAMEQNPLRVALLAAGIEQGIDGELGVHAF